MSVTPTATITFSDEQGMMLDTAADFAASNSPIAKVRDLIEDDLGYDPDTWRQIVELGWTGIAVPERFGGSGLGLAEVVTILEPLGQYLLTTPLASTTLAAQAMLAGTEEQQARVLSSVVEGAIATTALSEPDGAWDLTEITAKADETNDGYVLSGVKTFIENLHVADWVLVSVMVGGKPSIAIVPTSALESATRRRETVLDETRRSFQLDLAGVSIAKDDVFDPDFGRIRDVANLLLVAEMCGGIEGVLGVVVEYLNTRKAFDRFIGSYQALKHPTVDILMGLERSRSHLYHAASVFETEERELAARMGKASASEAFVFSGDRAVQFHGGFGFTYECDAQLFLRRALWCQSQHGDALYHKKHLSELLF